MKNREALTEEIKALTRPFLAGFWSVATFSAWVMVGYEWALVPSFFYITTGTCVTWFFASREKEKADAKKIERAKEG